MTPHYRSTLAARHAGPDDRELIPEWLVGLAGYRKPDEEERDLMLRFMSMVAKDTIPSILAILDGVVFLEGQEHPLELKCGDTMLSGSLLDIFPEQMEDDAGTAPRHLE